MNTTVVYKSERSGPAYAKDLSAEDLFDSKFRILTADAGGDDLELLESFE